MSQRKGVESSIALSDAAAMCKIDTIAAYPITPQTHIVEHLSELVFNGILDAEFIPCESEHSAISAACGTSAVGARTFTATSSQGLALMHEILFILPHMRLPIVMAVANRALSGPINIWNDHSDIMAEKDIGWIQLFAENGQECFDLTPLCFRVAEDPRVLLPTILNFDGFLVSHMIEPITYWNQKQVDEYLPEFKPEMKLDVKRPTAMGTVGVPEIYYEVRRHQHQVLLDSQKVVQEAFDELERIVGRKYNLIESFMMEDAEVALFIMGSLAETAMTAVMELRKEGIKAGIVRPRLWRPFPVEEFLKAIKHVSVLGIADRAFAFGAPHHPVATELRSMLYSVSDAPAITEYMLGIGGRDVTVDVFKDLYRKMVKQMEGDLEPSIDYVGVRE